jgi:CRP-like cAMP-binding protein
VSQPLQSSIRNRLLGAIAPADFALLRPHLVSVELSRAESLVEPGQAIQHSWFLEEGIASVVATTPGGHETEAGIIGRDGVADIATILGVDRASHRCFIQLPGNGYRLPAGALQAALDSSASLRKLMMGYVHSFMAQIAGTALANASHTVEQRLARWLLMCHDRIDGDQIAMTHEFLSLMLNVRRAGVTVAIQVLEKARYVSGHRGTITIRDRGGLKDFAANAYGGPEAVYGRLMGVE